MSQNDPPGGAAPPSGSEILDRLFAVIESRRVERPEGSYVTRLLDSGVPAVAAKIREEAEELIEAATAGHDSGHIAHEAADLLFHTWVLLASAGVSPAAVYDELSRRFGVGGLVEKAQRKSRSEDAPC